MSGFDPKYDPKQDEHTQAGVLADGFANAAASDPSVDDGATGNIGVGNTNNTTDIKDSNNDLFSNNDTDIDVDVKTSDDDTAIKDNGDNRDNSYNWDYDSKTITDTDVKTTDIDTNVNVAVADSFNTDSSSHDPDVADLDNVSGIDNIASAAGDLDFQLGDSYDFELNVDGILNDALKGDGNDTGFNIVQANSLADQDAASSITMDASHANNMPSANAGDAFGASGLNIDSDGGSSGSGGMMFGKHDPKGGDESGDGASWNLKVGDDLNASSVANASASLTESGIHMEVIQGANIAYNAVDISVVGHDSSTTDVSGDSSV